MMRALVLALALPATALATGFTDVDPPAAPNGKVGLQLDGAYRLRGELLHNLDLDRGLTPGGLPLFPVPLADPTAQALTTGDFRLRNDLTITGPGGGFDIKVRADLFDNAPLGGAAVGMPAASTTQRSNGAALVFKRAYAEAFTPVGVLSAGRMGNTWGLGMLANGGDCADCDSGDAADRLSFVTPLLGHLWALAYDFSATGPVVHRSDGVRPLDLEPSDDVRSVTFAFLKWRTPRSIERRARAGRATLDYGAYGSYRWQKNDVPSSWLPVAAPAPFGASQIVARDYQAGAVDGWIRFIHPSFRVELEAAALFARIGETSLLPGVQLRGAATSRQFGAALETDFGGLDARLHAGFDAGFASGDDAPGFGAFPALGGKPATKGELDGAQASFPNDLTVNDFRFHPDYRVDRILFREIIGTVTDAAYLRPHARWNAADFGPSHLSLSLAAIASFAIEPASTPSGSRPLGVELDPTVAWRHDDGFHAVLDYAVLFPLAAFDNPAEGKTAKPAQLLRLRLGWVF